MQVTSDQCRAARSLLNWSQEELATNANVSRTTIADFESNARKPIKNNLRAIRDSMFAAGVTFLSDEGKMGVGVRFRERRLEYTKNVRVNRFDGRATMQMRYSEKPIKCVIDLDAVDDFNRTNYKTDEEYTEAISRMLPTILSAVERKAATTLESGRIIVTSEVLKN